MQRSSRPGSLDLPPSQMQRNHSLSGDRISVSASTSLVSPPPVSPDPAYIAASAASQIVTSDHQSQIDDWFDDSGGKVDAEPITVSPASLTLINGFLDQLLYSVLSFARSTSIASLRPAVSEVLKPRLAKDAINGADEELEEFLGGTDPEESSSFLNNQETKGKWDLNLVWRRTRLRCMVYTRLGDMEEEDEEAYIEQERMEDVGNTADHRLSRDLGVISPAAAIFLTSILEFIGEHALMVAGEAAANRKEIKQHHADGELPRLVVEDTDVEKLAFNTTLGRLWRSWKKRVRAPSISSSRPISRELGRRRAQSTSGSPSISEADDATYLHETIQRPSVEEVLEEEQEPAGAFKDGQKDQNAEINETDPLAPTSTMGVSGKGSRPHSMVYAQVYHDISTSADQPPLSRDTRPSLLGHGYPKPRKRSSSLPTPAVLYGSPWSNTFAAPKNKLEIPLPGAFRDLVDQENIPPLEEDPSFISEDDYASDSDAMIPDGNKDGIDLGTLSGFTGLQASQDMRNSTADTSKAETESNNEKGREGPPPIRPSKTPAVDNDAPLGPQQTISQEPVHTDDLTVESARSELKEENDPTSDLVESQEINNENIREHHDHLHPAYDEPASEVHEKEPTKYLNSQQTIIPSPSAALQGQESWTETSATTTSIDESPVYVRTELQAQDLGSTPVKPNVYASGLEHGVPPLMPLQESMENAHHSSDTSSSGTHQDVSKPEDSLVTERFPSNDPPSPHSFSSSTPSHPKRSSGGNKRSDLRKELPAVSAAGADRAAVQRITNSPVFARDPVLPAARTSVSSNRPHTSASGTSQLSHKLKGMLGRESVDSIVQSTSTRKSSGDSGGSIIDKPSAKSPRHSSKQQSFEQLIKSDETIQYTLTPKNMRDMETTNKHISGSDHGREPVGLDGSHRIDDSTDLNPGARPVNGRSALTVKGIDGLRSNPLAVNPKRRGPLSNPAPTSRPDAGKSRVVSTSINGRISGGGFTSASGRYTNIEPRDARAKKETMSEIAEFIRSTGPEIIPRPALSPSNKTNSNIPREASGSQRSSSRRISKQYPSMAVGSPKRTKSKLQAREPTVSYDSQTSDLIDFIRQGPAHDHTDGSHRIPRSVAPFRSTMDSDEIQALGNGKARESSSVASTQDSLVNTKSIHSSSNSRTGLLENSRRSNMKNSGSPLVNPNPPRLDEPPQPARKQYRSKDPFPIDPDNDAGDENYRPTAPRQEESLAEFLRNVTPHAGAHIPSAFDGIPQPKRNTVHRKTSGNGIREQFIRTASSQSSKTSGSKNTIGAASISSSTRRKNGGSQVPPPSPRETSPHLFVQNGTKFDMYRPTKPTYAAHIDRERNGSRRGHPQARGEREPDSSMTELASFLKNSGPPTPPLEKPPPAIGPKGHKEESGFGRLFSRRKRSTQRL